MKTTTHTFFSKLKESKNQEHNASIASPKIELAHFEIDCGKAAMKVKHPVTKQIVTYVAEIKGKLATIRKPDPNLDAAKAQEIVMDWLVKKGLIKEEKRAETNESNFAALFSSSLTDKGLEATVISGKHIAWLFIFDKIIDEYEHGGLTPLQVKKVGKLFMKILNNKFSEDEIKKEVDKEFKGFHVPNLAAFGIGLLDIYNDLKKLYKGDSRFKEYCQLFLLDEKNYFKALVWELQVRNNPELFSDSRFQKLRDQVSGVPASFRLCALVAKLRLLPKDFSNVKHQSQFYGGVHQLCKVNDIVSFLKETLETIKDITEVTSNKTQSHIDDLHLNFIINRAQVLAQDPKIENPLQSAIDEAFAIANQELWNFVNCTESRISEKLKENCIIILKCLFDNIEWSLLNPRYKHARPVINGIKRDLELTIKYEYIDKPLNPIEIQEVDMKPSVYFELLESLKAKIDPPPVLHRKVPVT